MTSMRRRDALLSLAGLVAFAGVQGPSRALARGATPFTFTDIYARDNVLSEAAVSLTGSPITMRGFMAPPLKPDIAFFVLTKLPMTVCPFCSDGTEWPEDIVVVYLEGELQFVPYYAAIEVEGRLDTGFITDPETGFVSLVRMREARYRTL
jgi:hypothetical protein